METTIVGYIEVIFGLYKDTGKENGNYYSRLYRGPNGPGVLPIRIRSTTRLKAMQQGCFKYWV